MIANQPDLTRSGSFQSQSQGGHNQGGHDYGQAQNNYGGEQQQQGRSGPMGPVSLFVPPAPGTSGDWWPDDLRWPNSTGAQNGVRYAYFAQARRLAIEVNGRVTVYDKLNPQIGGFSQQQSVGGSLTFSSQYGLIDVLSLPIMSIDGVAPATTKPALPEQVLPEPSSPTPASIARAPVRQDELKASPASPGIVQSSDVFAPIEKLADLHAKGVLSNEEFSSKKADLLGRL